MLLLDLFLAFLLNLARLGPLDKLGVTVDLDLLDVNLLTLLCLGDQCECHLAPSYPDPTTEATTHCKGRLFRFRRCT